MKDVSLWDLQLIKVNLKSGVFRCWRKRPVLFKEQKSIESDLLARANKDV